MTTPSPAADAARLPVSHRLIATLAALQAVLFLVPMIVLGQAINWPASLRFPASEVLPLIAAKSSAVLVGYWAYLIFSLLIIPFAFVMRDLLRRHGIAGPAIDALTFVGAASGIVKTLGIVRWLSVMPVLAEQYARSEANRPAIEVAYLAFNAYAGSVGELLGVQLFGGLWLTGIGVALVRMRWSVTGVGAIAAGILFLATCLRTAVPAAAGLQMIAVPLGLLWFVAIALVAWRERH